MTYLARLFWYPTNKVVIVGIGSFDGGVGISDDIKINGIIESRIKLKEW